MEEILDVAILVVWGCLSFVFFSFASWVSHYHLHSMV